MGLLFDKIQVSTAGTKTEKIIMDDDYDDHEGEPQFGSFQLDGNLRIRKEERKITTSFLHDDCSSISKILLMQ